MGTNGKLAASTTRTSRTLPNPMISALTRNSSDGRSMISAPSPTTCRPLPSDSPDLSPVSSTSATTMPKNDEFNTKRVHKQLKRNNKQLRNFGKKIDAALDC